MRVTLRFLLLFGLLGTMPALAQTDFSGEWATLMHEGGVLAGSQLGDYLGVPLNDAARLRAQTSSNSDWGLPEFQCRPHSAPFQWRAAGGLRILKEIDPVSRQLTAYHFQWVRSLDRPIYMDGRPHPPAYAPHTWSGFSTGRWDGEVMVVTTTHLKESYLQRNGVPYSDQATMTEYVMRDGDLLTIVIQMDDPIHLDEPYINSVTYRLAPDTQLPFFPCTVIEENIGNAVPHFLPGKNPYLTEWATDEGIPFDAAMGGAETLYPEYRSKLKNAKPVSSTAAAPRPTRADTRAAAEVQVLPVRGNIYMLIAGDTNIAASVGRDGVLLVDAGPPQMTDKILETVRQLSKAVAAPLVPLAPGGASPYGWASPAINATIGSVAPPKPIRYIINTTFDPTHTGGNDKIAAAGATITGGNIASTQAEAGSRAAVIAHENALTRMMETSDTEPSITETYHLPSYKLSHFFNGEGIQIFHQPAARTDGDSIVAFRFSDVIVAGDLMSTTSYPIIDLENGGSIQGVIDGLNRILELAIPEFRSQGGTLIIPGHGRLVDTGDVANYRNMVSIIRDRIQALIDEGMTLDQVKAAKPIRDYDVRYGANKDWTSDMFVEAVYRSLKQNKENQ
jgi:cyclase